MTLERSIHEEALQMMSFIVPRSFQRDGRKYREEKNEEAQQQINEADGKLVIDFVGLDDFREIHTLLGIYHPIRHITIESTSSGTEFFAHFEDEERVSTTLDALQIGKLITYVKQVATIKERENRKKNYLGPLA